MKWENTATSEILIIDDNPDNLRILTDMLKQRHYRIRPAISGKLGLEAARLKSPHLILLDLILPDIPGLELITCLKNNPATAQIPIIIISALNTIEDKIKAFKAGCIDYISKPFQMEEVLIRVHLHLEVIKNRVQLMEKEQALTYALQESERNKNELKALLMSARSIMECSYFQDEARIILDNCCRATGCTGGYFKLKNDNDESYSLICGSEPPLQPVLSELERQVVEEGYIRSDNTHNVLMVPVTEWESVIGIICLTGKPAGFNQDDYRIAAAFRELASIGYLNYQNGRRMENSEKRFRQALETLPLPVVMYTSSGEILLVNKAWEKITGYSRNDMQSIPFWVSRAQVSQNPFNLKEALAFISGGEKDIRTLEGETRCWVFRSTRLEAIPTGQESTISIATDITDRKEAEKALKMSNKRLTKVLETNVIGIMYCDNRGRVQEANDALLNMIGYTRKELEGGGISWKKLTPPEFVDQDILAFQELKSSSPIAPYEKNFIHKNGDLIPVLLGIAALTEVPTDFVCFIIDLSIQKTAEKQIKKSLAEKEVLLQEIHHRVKNNLQIISSILGLQLRLLEEPRARELFEDTKNRIHTMSLIHQLLYQSGDFGNIDIQRYIRALTNFLQQSSGITGQHINIRIIAANIVLTLNKAIPCGLILNELVSNCLKHAYPAGREGVIEIHFQKWDKNNFLMRVKDDGIGIPLPREGQEHDSLGLKLVRTLTEQLNGTIEIKNEGGTDIYIRFPGERRAG